jgi:hypothetical protein
MSIGHKHIPENVEKTLHIIMPIYATIRMSKRNGPIPTGIGPFCFSQNHGSLKVFHHQNLWFCGSPGAKKTKNIPPPPLKSQRNPGQIKENKQDTSRKDPKNIGAKSIQSR